MADVYAPNPRHKHPWQSGSRGPMASVLWFQGGACSGNTMSFLNADEPNADEPNVVDLIVDFGLDLVRHPSRGLGRPRTPTSPPRT